MNPEHLTMVLMILLAYTLTEFTYFRKLHVIFRTLILLGLLLAPHFWLDLSPKLWVFLPIGLIYLLVSIGYDLWVEKKPERWSGLYLAKQLLFLVAFIAIGIPKGQLLWPIGDLFLWGGFRDRLYLLLLLWVFALNIFAAPHIIRALLDRLTYKTCQLRGGGDASDRLTDDGAYHAGTMIGILERLLILVVGFISFWGGSVLNISFIGLILGTKSLARFKKFDNQEFVEYFIVGTLTSVLIAVISLWILQVMVFRA